ncbi:MAG: nitroreductase family deazaflavin-dependent oxidoreductase [Candidatus Dormibacteraeota bacterium]|nr:nitroreductase family deazaflavin-dependent oxidoreductase [Candidatus Dormibacteraeota bacterium]
MATTARASFRIAGAVHRTLYRLGLGRKMFGVPVLILETRGRKSRREIRTPLTYFKDDAGIFVVASKGGAPTDPGWYHNLVAEPNVTARIGSVEQRFRAEVVRDRAERDRLYAIAVSAMSGYAGYEKKTDRMIPVVRLHGVAG